MQQKKDTDYEEGLENIARQNYQQAITCFKKSAANGNTEALFQIGELYCGNLMDHQKAAYWYGRAMRKHHTGAMVSLAILHYYGSSGKENKSYAFVLFERAAKLGNDQAMLELSSFYFYVRANKRNYRKAVYWLQRSAIMGNVLAMEDLAGYYLEAGAGKKSILKRHYTGI